MRPIGDLWLFISARRKAYTSLFRSSFFAAAAAGSIEFLL